MTPLGFSPAMSGRATEAVLPETGYILTASEQVDQGGGTETTYAKGPAIACAIAPLKGGEYTGIRAQTKPTGDRADARTTHVITAPAGTEVSETSRIEIEGWGTFEVTALRRRSIEVLREIEAREVP